MGLLIGQCVLLVRWTARGLYFPTRHRSQRSEYYSRWYNVERPRVIETLFQSESVMQTAAKCLLTPHRGSCKVTQGVAKQAHTLFSAFAALQLRATHFYNDAVLFTLNVDGLQKICWQTGWGANDAFANRAGLQQICCELAWLATRVLRPQNRRVARPENTLSLPQNPPWQ